MNSLKTTNLIAFQGTLSESLLDNATFPWEALPLIKDAILALISTLNHDDYNEVAPGVWIGSGTTVAATATITAPCIIGRNCEVRPGAYLRGNTLIGDNCVIGNSTELKNVVLVGKVQVPHYNYVGDSILGFGAHLGAGAITSNVKADRTLVVVKNGDTFIETGLKKFGAILGDYAEIGCNAVLNPGTVIGRHSSVYPTISVRGVIPPDSIVKSTNEIIMRTKK